MTRRWRAGDIDRASIDLSGVPTPPEADGVTVRRSRRRRRPAWVPALATGVCLLLLGAGLLVWRAVPLRDSAEAASTETAAGTRPPAVTAEPLEEPTPIFARYRSMQVHLPVPCKAVTVIAFHQAARDNALHLASLLPDASMSKAAELRKRASYTYTTGSGNGTDAAEVSAAEQGVPAILSGQVLRLWRSSRHGAPDSAADVGAKPGTTVFAPVSGTVLLVRPYKLYGEFHDYEVHIQPQAWPEVDCVLIHVTDVTVQASDTVVGGVTPIARVRDLARKVQPQLGQYTPDAGDHVHVQLNRLEVPGRIDLLGGS
ncbi:MAG: hypothetical protein C0418_00285 [Coriobacteriaceae bacterium]|nr:hypothetical protein [Coriobacteriaceae bacterium]